MNQPKCEQVNMAPLLCLGRVDCAVGLFSVSND